eukprot:scaffold12161_cov81-Skeletonema_dohrnii-CCMP3373.AAC.7
MVGEDWGELRAKTIEECKMHTAYPELPIIDYTAALVAKKLSYHSCQSYKDRGETETEAQRWATSNFNVNVEEAKTH